MTPLDEWIARYVRDLQPGHVLTERDVAVLRYLLGAYQLSDPDTLLEHKQHLFRWWCDELKKLHPDKTVSWIVEDLIAKQMNVSKVKVYRWMGGRKR